MADKSPSPLIVRRFIWYVSSFMVGVGVGLAPFLGLVEIPGFRGLLDLFPLQLQDDLIPISAFLMGLIAVGVQFLSTERVRRAALAKSFRIGFVCLLLLLLALLVLYRMFVVRVLIPDADRRIAVLVGWSQENDCCRGARSISECVQTLSFDETAIESCWGTRDIAFASLLLSVPYLALTGGVGALIGIVILLASPAAPRHAAWEARSRGTMSGIFICYRRDDAGGYVHALRERLAARLGPEQVFMDVDSIEPGFDFLEVIQSSVASCAVLLAVIGKRWLQPEKLQDSRDFVRLEIRTALERKVRVIPVLLDGAAMPKLEELPADLAPLVGRQAHEISNRRFSDDADELAELVERILRS